MYHRIARHYVLKLKLQRAPCAHLTAIDRAALFDLLKQDVRPLAAKVAAGSGMTVTDRTHAACAVQGDRALYCTLVNPSTEEDYKALDDALRKALQPDARDGR